MRLQTLLAAMAAAVALAQEPEAVSTDWRAAVNRVSADSLRGHVSFLASDLLEGRATPSRGQDIATEYIAAQFRRMGLEPGGTDGYFQITPWTGPKAPRDGVNVTVQVGGRKFTYDARNATVVGTEAVAIQELSGVIWTRGEKNEAEGKAAIVLAPDISSGAEEVMGAGFQFRAEARQHKAAMSVFVDPSGLMETGLALPTPRPESAKAQSRPRAPMVFLTDPELAAALKNAKGAPVSISASAPALEWRPFPMRNVVGVLRGSDPVLKDTYVVISAHHDHIGMLTPGASGDDRVFNGANDDASGTAGVLEAADALSKLHVRPKRSIVFATFAGEELGLLGSEQFAKATPISVDKVIADLNLEIMGRTDTAEHAVGKATVTGFAFTTLSQVLERAGKLTGLEVYGEPRFSDSFFDRSDNIALAKRGIPAVTISSGYIYPDYHGLKDEWDRLDYVQMAGVTRMVTLASLMLADSADVPKWNEIPATESYREAHKKLEKRR